MVSPTMLVPAGDEWSPMALGSAVKGWFEGSSPMHGLSSFYDSYPADPADVNAETIQVVRNLAPGATWHADEIPIGLNAPTLTLTAAGRKLLVGNGSDRCIGKNAAAGYDSNATAGFVGVVFSSNATTGTRCSFWLPSTSNTRYFALGYTPAGFLGILIQNSGSTYFGSSDIAAANGVMHAVACYQDGTGMRLWTATGSDTAMAEDASITWSATPAAGFWFNSYTTNKPRGYSFQALQSTTAGVTFANHNFGGGIHVEGTLSTGNLNNMLRWLNRRRLYYAS